MKKLLKKAFTVSVVAVTIMWSIGLAALVPTVVNAADPVCPTVSAGSIIKAVPPKGANPLLYTAMYMVTSDMKKAYFPDGAALKSWYGGYHGTNIDPIRVDMTPNCVTNFPSASPAGVGPMPGSRLVKIGQSSSLFMVEAGNKWTEVSVDVAKALFGTNYTNFVSTYNEYQDFATSKGTKVDSLTKLTFEGMLVKKIGTTDVYQVVGGKLNKVDGTLPGYVAVREVAANQFDATEKSTTTVTAASTYANPMQTVGTGTGTTVPTVAGAVTVSLAADTPAAGYVAKSAYNADFTKLTFKNTSSATVRLDKVVVKRDGLGYDADITAVRLYDGSAQLGSDQALNTNTHLATFNNINWDVKAGETKTLTVKADTSASAAGTNDYLAVTVLGLEGEGTITASLPINGNALQYSALSVGGLDIDVLATPGATTLISGAAEQELACWNFAASSTEGIYLSSVTFTNNGTLDSSLLSNFVLKDGATVVGKNTGALNSSSKVTVDLTTALLIEKSKSKNLCLLADIGAGITLTTRTIIMEVTESKDVIGTGESSKGQVVATAGNWTTFAAETGATMTVDQGTLSVSRNTATLPVTSGLVAGTTHNKIESYKFTAGSTEGMKVTRLRLTVSGSGVGATDLSNFELYKYDETTATETQVGSSQSISGSYVTFEDTADGLFDVAAGKNVVVNVYADVNTAASWSGTVAGVFVGTAGANSNLIVKAKGVKSGDYVAAGDISLSSVDSEHTNNVLFSLTANGSLVISLANDSPSATSKAKGSNDVDFAHYKLYATGEDITVAQLVVRAYNSNGNTNSTASSTNEFVNVRLYDITTPASPVQLGTAVQTPSSGVSTFSFSLTIPKDGYKILKVVADIPTASAGLGYLHFDVPGAGTIADDITSTGVKSGVALDETGTATGKTMTLSAPTLGISWASGPTNNVVLSASEQTLGTLQLTAGQYEDVRVSTIKVEVSSSTSSGVPAGNVSDADSDLTNFKLVGLDGTQYGVTKNLTSGAIDYATFDGITNLVVTKGTTKIVYVKANIAAATGSNYYVGNTATTNISASGAVSGNSATVSGTGAGPLNTINTVATLTFAVDASSPATKLVAVGANGTGTEETMLVLSADSLYEDVDITKLVLNVVSGSSSDLVQQAFQENGVKLYHKVGSATETLVGSATLVSSTDAGLATYYAVTFNVNSGDLRIGKSADDLLLVKAVFKGTDTGLSSAVSPLFKLGNGTNADDSLFIEARGVSSGTALDDGQFNTTSALNQSSSQMKMYKSYPTFTYVNPGTTLVNGVENDIYSFRVRANGGTVALKQLQFTLDVVDNEGTYDGSMSVGTFKLYRGDTNISDNVQIAKAAGTDLKATVSFVTGTGQAFYINWPTTGEETIPSGTEYTYTIKATLSGFATDADNDYVRVRIANTDTSELSQANGTYYLTPWGSTASIYNLLTLQGSAGTNIVATSTPISMIWSDRNASNHSATTGTYSGGTASGSGDWFNGYYVKDTPTNYSMLTR